MRRLAGALAAVAFAAWVPNAFSEEPAPQQESLPEIAAPAQSWQAKAEKDQWTRARIALNLDEKHAVEVVREIRVTAVETDAKGRHVAVAIASESGGNKDKVAQRFVVPVGAKDAEPATPEAEKPLPAETVAVGGQKLECQVSERKEKMGDATVAVKTWRSEKVPLGGTVRIDHNGKAVYELLDFGPRAP